MFLALLLLFVAALFAIPACRRLGRGAVWVLPLPFVGVAVLLGTRLPDALHEEGIRQSVPWVRGLSLDFALRLDGLSWLFAMLVAVIGALVLVHASGYFRGDSRLLGRFAALTSLFATAMLGLVLADDLFVLFVFWELTSICSFLLIGLKHEHQDARDGALRALLVTGGGGIAMLIGFVLLSQAADTSSISVLLQRGDLIRSSSLYVPALLLILAGAFTKSAQVPFHYWLPGAMAAPAPVSAYLHSATLVNAGVYLLARLHPALGVRPEWHWILGHVGAVTMLVGAAMAFGQRDLKRMLADTTIAGLGTTVLLLGIGTATALRAALVFVAVHALYKAALFMVVGILDKRTGLRDVDRLRGLGRSLPLLFLTALVAAMSMAGLPPLVGAIAKELVYEAKLGAPEAPGVLAAVGFSANALMVACAVLVGLRPFIGRGEATRVEPAIAPVALLLPPALLATTGVLLGVVHEGLMAPLIEAAVRVMGAEPATAELLADTAPTAVSWLAKGTLFAGVVLFVFRSRALAWSGVLRRGARRGPARLHDGMMGAVAAVASRVADVSTRRPVAASVAIVGVAVVVITGRALVLGGLPPFPGDRVPAAHEFVLVALVLAGAASAVFSRTPAAAVIALGVIGVGTGLLFLLLGGPDLALTQVAVDALAVLLLLLVLRRTRPVLGVRKGWLQGGLALAVGAGFMLLTWAAIPDGHLRPVSQQLSELSWPVAYGRNVVNVILVDMRALDTLGEIVVLTAAAIGVVALLRGGRQEART